MFERVGYLNGRFVPESELKIPIWDYWTMYGECIFEMLRSFNGVHFKLGEHIGRLRNGLRTLEIPDPHTFADWNDLCHEVTSLNNHGNGEEHRLMINVSRGILGIYEEAAAQTPGQVTVCISDFPLRWTVRGMGSAFDRGLDAVIPQQRQIPSTYLNARIKHRSRLHFVSANRQVSGTGRTSWALLTDDNGYITEGTGANVFLVKDGNLYTPKPLNVLLGISRRFVMDELQGAVECDLNDDDLLRADEAFFTGTPFCMLPITSLAGTPIGTGQVGPVYKRLLARWSEMVGVDIKRQIQQWDTEPSNVSSPYAFKAT